MRPLVWLRSDLRVDDHPALHAAAAAAGKGVVAVFVVCPRQWREKHDWADVKVGYLLRSLRWLKEALEELRIPLLIAESEDFSGVPEVLLELAREHDCDALFFNRELEVYERRRDEAVEERFEEAGLEVRTFHDQTIVEPGAVCTGDGDFYKVFTPFHRSWKEVVQDRGMGDVLGRPERQPELVCPGDEVPAEVAGFDLEADREDLWPGGSEAALDRLRAFLDERAPRYPKKRDYPAVEGTSLTSPALALGVLSARQCLAEAMTANEGELDSGDKGLAAWMRQLAWREFYRHVLVGFPRVSKGRAFKEETEALDWREDEEQLEAWRRGRTGFPYVDAGMRQMLETGWMHNRLRMAAAMFLSKNLLIDWRHGERHFMRHLVDGDLANNNGGWQWAASTGTDAAPYFRLFNPWTQGRRYDEEGEYIRRFVPELEGVPAPALHDPEKLVGHLGDRDYPRPIVDHSTTRERAIAAFKDL